MVHHVDRSLAVLDADVDVQAEDQVGARDHLHVLDDLLVALVGMDLLRAPVGERMRAAGGEPQAVLLAPGAPSRAAVSLTSALASLMFLQTPVPTSTTDWCISALTRSWRIILPFARISAWMCERRSRVTGSIVWYSSSIPMVKVGDIEAPMLGIPAARFPRALRCGWKSVRQNSSFAPLGLRLFPLLTHALRRGLHSFAASRLNGSYPPPFPISASALLAGNPRRRGRQYSNVFKPIQSRFDSVPLLVFFHSSSYDLFQ